MKKLQNEPLHNVRCLPNTISHQIKEDGWARHIACMEIINSYRTVLEKYEEKRSLVRHKHRWKDCIKINMIEYNITEYECLG